MTSKRVILIAHSFTFVLHIMVNQKQPSIVSREDGRSRVAKVVGSNPQFGSCQRLVKDCAAERFSCVFSHQLLVIPTYFISKDGTIVEILPTNSSGYPRRNNSLQWETFRTLGGSRLTR